MTRGRAICQGRVTHRPDLPGDRQGVGRRFQLLSVFAPLHTPGHVLVAYPQHMVLSIPFSATGLAPPTCSVGRASARLQAVLSIICMLTEYERLFAWESDDALEAGVCTSGDIESHTSSAV